jgi:D-alanyl-lipoteichoic acid acyltransferase DltB (MBOAT superfamily)
VLFNSIEFLFFFLPLTLAIYWAACRLSPRYGAHTINAASLVFYALWIPYQLPVLLGSVVVNFVVGRRIQQGRSFALLCLAIAFNIALLGYYKYLGFTSEILEQIGLSHGIYAVLLPLGISFYTFQQIAYLVDIWRGRPHEPSFGNYLLFISFFPHIVAGPIVRNWQLIPQFPQLTGLRRKDLVIGGTIFAIGLFKKTVFGDGMAVHSNAVFDAIYSGATIGAFDAWFGILAFSLEIYFDFSGYSDMAVGLARMFSIRIPMNFDSPYKARNVIDFWRRWHITLSLFLRDYLYVPLGGNRQGEIRRYANLLFVMLLGGLWHGANWTFLLWGGLHGLLLVVAHLWRNVKRRLDLPSFGFIGRAGAILITFIAISLVWIPFRSDNLDVTFRTFEAAFGMHGLRASTLIGSEAALSILLLLVFVWIAPNTQEFMGRYRPVLSYGRPRDIKLQWRPQVIWGVFIAFLAFAALNGTIETSSKFIYFQF